MTLTLFTGWQKQHFFVLEEIPSCVHQWERFVSWLCSCVVLKTLKSCTFWSFSYLFLQGFPHNDMLQRSLHDKCSPRRVRKPICPHKEHTRLHWLGQDCVALVVDITKASMLILFSLVTQPATHLDCCPQAQKYTLTALANISNHQLSSLLTSSQLKIQALELYIQL